MLQGAGVAAGPRAGGQHLHSLTVPVPPPGLPPAADMANKGPAYGMSRDVQSKIEKKYDDELEDRLVEWIVAQCGAAVGRPERGRLGFQVWLKNGIVSGGEARRPRCPPSLGLGGQPAGSSAAGGTRGKPSLSSAAGPQQAGEQPLP